MRLIPRLSQGRSMKIFLVVVAAALVTGCSEPASTQGHAQVPATSTSITITSKSPEAIAHFQKGEVLLDNLRTEEASQEFNQALKLDPDFVLARAYLGQATPGPDGLKEIDSAKQSSASLPEAERVLIQGIAADRRGDLADARASFARVTELVPGDWRGHYLLGQELLNQQKYADAVQALCSRLVSSS
jgi:tetratricopeptide (TPR) repeat protein